MLIIASVENFNARIPVGWFPEEKITKTNVIISLKISYELEEITDNLSNVIDYQQMSLILQKSITQDYKLLEMFGQEIINACSSHFGHFSLQSISIEIKKPVILLSQVNSDFHVIFLEKKF